MPGRKGADHRSSTSYQPKDPPNRRTEKPLCFRPYQTIADEIDRRRGEMTRQDYLTLLVAYALTATQGAPPFEMLPALGPFLKRPDGDRADAPLDKSVPQVAT